MIIRPVNRPKTEIQNEVKSTKAEYEAYENDSYTRYRPVKIPKHKMIAPSKKLQKVTENGIQNEAKNVIQKIHLHPLSPHQKFYKNKIQILRIHRSCVFWQLAATWFPPPPR